MDSGAPIKLVVTKLTAPTPPTELVGRPRLEQALFDAVSAPTVRVVLISAPAGSGKSTLVAGWLDRAESCAWLQLDSADCDPARFWGHAVAALGRAVPDIEASVGPAVAQSGTDSAPLVETLANALAAYGEPVVLVLDDYHLVNNPAIDAAVEQLIETAPHNFTLVVCTRLDPPLRLSRLRVRGQLAEIRAGDLRFEPDEAATLLEHRGASSQRHHVDALCERTEGWAAGLVLAELSLAGAVDRDAFVEDFRGDDRLVVDYLTDEFLSQASEGDRHRYLTTSILDELSGPLVDAVCDSDDGTAWLQATAATNQLVIGLDRSRNWFRYHHLLRDMLRLEAQTVLEVDELHRRAGQWHRTNGNLDRAADHLLAAGELRTAADVIADYSMDLLNRGQSDTVDRYLAQLGEVLWTHPICLAFYGWLHLARGRIDDADVTLQRLRALETDDFALGFISTLGVMINLARGDLASALRDAELVPASPDATVTLTLGQVHVWAGQFEQAQAHLRRAAALAEENGDLFARAGTPVMEAIIAMESQRSGDALQLAERALTVLDERKHGERLHLALAHSIIGRTSDDPEVAAVAVETGVDAANRTANNINIAYALTSAADVLTFHGHPDGPARLTEARRLIDRCVDPGIVGSYVARIEGREGTAAPAHPVGLVEELTSRELAVLRYLPSAMSQRDIANELYVSLNTVKTHCKAIYRKLAVGNRKAAVQAARELDLL